VPTPRNMLDSRRTIAGLHHEIREL
jgi:hypothetical protein